MNLRVALTALPFIGLLGGVFFANRTTPYVLGLPFLVFYVTAWLPVTSVVMVTIGWLDRRRAVGTASRGSAL